MSADCVIAMSAGTVVDSFSVSVSLPLPTVLYSSCTPVRDSAVLNYMTSMRVHMHTVVVYERAHIDVEIVVTHFSKKRSPIPLLQKIFSKFTSPKFPFVQIHFSCTRFSKQYPFLQFFFSNTRFSKTTSSIPVSPKPLIQCLLQQRSFVQTCCFDYHIICRFLG